MAGSSPSSDTSSFTAYDMVETEDGVHVFMDLPGMGSTAFDVSFDGHELVVTGTRPAFSTTDKYRFLSSTRLAGDFRAAVRMPDDIELDAETLDAVYMAGVLKIFATRKVQKRRVVAVRFSSVDTSAPETPA
eukprot:a4224_17.p1 GENE.a4224_17~~a4224_17.p1  ORF type:complete len:145 (+),score=54.18 a4224_17:41-436(+)